MTDFLLTIPEEIVDRACEIAELAERTVHKARELVGTSAATKVEHAGRKGGRMERVEE